MAKFLLKGVVLGATLLSLGLTAGTANAANASADAKAKVLRKLTITKQSDLDFGRIVPSDTTAGPVSVDAAGVKACVNHVCPDAFTRASFEVQGTKDTVVTVNVPVTALTLVTAAGPTGPTMALNLNSNSWTGGTITLPTNGRQTIFLGGSLQVAANQAEGDYVKSFTVEVDYQ